MYTYEKYNLQLFPWFLVLVGAGLAVAGMYTEAALFGTPGALTCISFKGLNVDPETRRIRQYNRFLWFYFGKWVPFSSPLYVTVVRIKLSSSRVAPLPFLVLPQGKSASSYKMNLVVDGPERYYSLTYGQRHTMMEEALKIARLLGVKVLDYTTHKKQWITP